MGRTGCRGAEDRRQGRCGAVWRPARREGLPGGPVVSAEGPGEVWRCLMFNPRGVVSENLSCLSSAHILN